VARLGSQPCDALGCCVQPRTHPGRAVRWRDAFMVGYSSWSLGAGNGCLPPVIGSLSYTLRRRGLASIGGESTHSRGLASLRGMILVCLSQILHRRNFCCVLPRIRGPAGDYRIHPPAPACHRCCGSLVLERCASSGWLCRFCLLPMERDYHGLVMGLVGGRRARCVFLGYSLVWRLPPIRRGGAAGVVGVRWRRYLGGWA